MSDYERLEKRIDRIEERLISYEDRFFTLAMMIRKLQDALLEERKREDKFRTDP